MNSWLATSILAERYDAFRLAYHVAANGHDARLNEYDSFRLSLPRVDPREGRLLRKEKQCLESKGQEASTLLVDKLAKLDEMTKQKDTINQFAQIRDAADLKCTNLKIDIVEKIKRMKNCLKDRKVFRIGDLSLIQKFKNWNDTVVSVNGVIDRATREVILQLKEASKAFNVEIPETVLNNTNQISDVSPWMSCADRASVHDVYHLAYFEDDAEYKLLVAKVDKFPSTVITEEEKNDAVAELVRERFDSDATNRIVNNVLEIDDDSAVSVLDKKRTRIMLKFCSLVVQKNMMLQRSLSHQLKFTTVRMRLLVDMELVDGAVNGAEICIHKASEVSLVSKYKEWVDRNISIRGFKNVKERERPLIRDVLEAFSIQVSF